MEINVYTIQNILFCKVCVPQDATIDTLKQEIVKHNKNLTLHRIAIRTNTKGKNLKGDAQLQSLDLQNGDRLFIKDLGPQVSWRTVFILEYIGPPIIYSLIALRPKLIYGDLENRHFTRACLIAMVCWLAHFIKRLYETVCVHRFSHATMPGKSLLKNCAYYWGFAFIIAIHMNHPLYTSPNEMQSMLGLVFFALCELGNFSVHLLFRDLRPAGSTLRKMPIPNRNVFTKLFHFVSCPNYTYEFGAWLSYAVMTSCVPAYLFAFVGLYQMSVWALEKHRAYVEEFANYPERKAIIPFVL